MPVFSLLFSLCSNVIQPFLAKIVKLWIYIWSNKALVLHVGIILDKKGLRICPFPGSNLRCKGNDLLPATQPQLGTNSMESTLSSTMNNVGQQGTEKNRLHLNIVLWGG